MIAQSVILDRLKPEFDQFKQSLLFDDALTLDTCTAKLLEAGERLNFEGEIDATRVSMQALAVNQPASRRNKKDGAGAGPGAGRTDANGKMLVCRHCKKEGHTQDRCYTLHPELKPKGGQKGDAKKAAEHVWSVSSTAKVVTQLPGYITFEVDSGASDHFVNTLAGVSEFDRSKTIEIVVADGRALTTGGTGCLPGRLPTVNYVPSFCTSLLSVSNHR